MRSAKIFLCILSIPGVCVTAQRISSTATVAVSLRGHPNVGLAWRDFARNLEQARSQVAPYEQPGRTRSVTPTIPPPRPKTSRTPVKNKRIVIAASALLDGKGRVLRDTRIVIEGSKIVRIDPKAAPVNYDLRGLTVLPGWIDAHVHITWSFGKDGRNAGGGGIRKSLSTHPASRKKRFQ